MVQRTASYKRGEIGADGPPVGEWHHGICRGIVYPELKGQGALVSFNKQNRCVAQFDDRATGFGHGWHAWDGRDFDVSQRSTDEPRFEVSQDGGPMHAALLNIKPKLDNY